MLLLSINRREISTKERGEEEKEGRKKGEEEKQGKNKEGQNGGRKQGAAQCRPGVGPGPCRGTEFRTRHGKRDPGSFESQSGKHSFPAWRPKRSFQDQESKAFHLKRREQTGQV